MKGGSKKGDVAKQIRQAIGASEDDVIEIRTPQFNRLPSDPAPACHPPSPAAWEDLRKMDRAALKEMGLRQWDDDVRSEVLMLLPGEWYQHIPEGFALWCINGEPEAFKNGETDDDIRFGCLAYGIKVKS